MKVKAIGDSNYVVGYYGNRRIHGGQVFYLKPRKHTNRLDRENFGKVISVEEQFSEKWMEKMKDQSPEKNASSDLNEEEFDIDTPPVSDDEGGEQTQSDQDVI